MDKYKKLTIKDFGVKKKEKILKNGCRLVLFEKKNSPLFMSVKFLAGSRFNPKDKEGLAHFVEHMLSSGTKKFVSKDKLAMFLERYGGSFGLSTNNNFININTETGDISDLDILMNFLNEIINNSTFKEDVFLTEKGSIINEIGNASTLPWKLFGEAFLNTFYKNTLLEKNNLGSEDSVKKIKLVDVIDFYKKNITSQNCTIIASGDIKIEKLAQKIEQKIKFRNEGENKIRKIIEPLPEKGGRITVLNTLSNQSLFIVGFRVDPKIEQGPAMEVLRMILAGGRASRLEKKLRYEKGLIYSVSANYDTYQDVGGFFIKTASSEENTSKVLKIIFSEIEDIKKNGVTKEELSFIKQKTYKSIKKDLQTSKDWVNNNSTLASLEKNGTTKIDVINEIMKVSSKDMVDIVNKYFSKEKSFIGLYTKNVNKV